MVRILFFILFVLTLSAVAQREDHTWYFSNTNKGLFFDFSTNLASITNVHAPMNEAGGFFVASMPLTGDVMFYTDGSKIFDIDFHGNNNPQFYTFDLQSFA